ncbi:MAG: hypothetical protein JSS76_17345 [Bacteroidetes bacterium]|nr:hypothetical protein [Bacteroidota bacterium]MBS1686507.1 hypothetical protein [Bacteroidota bacterium]
MRVDYYQARYKTGKRSIVAGAVAVAGAVFLLLIGLAGEAEMLPISIVIVLFAVGCEVHFLRRYREVLLYDDRMEIITLFSGQVLSLPFSGIRHIGFIKSCTHYGYNQRLSQGAVETVEGSELIILTEGNGRYEFSDDDYDHLPDICTFIRQHTHL